LYFVVLWTLLDKVEWMSITSALFRFLVIDIVLTVIAFWRLNRNLED
jgi:hypothetical protein